MSNANDIHNDNDANKKPEQLEREVDQARARLDRTASELSDRLSPGELIDQVLSMTREHGGDFGRNLGTQIKNNPMPLLLTSVGISWMMMSGKNPPAHRYDTHNTGSDKVDKIKEAFSGAAAKSHDKAEAVSERVHNATSHIKGSAHNASADMKASAQSARECISDFYREQPLLAGSLGVAIGAALAALIPSTQFEDEKLGKVSDRSLDAAKSKAEEKYEEVRESARSR